MLHRRSLITGLISLVAAPAIVRIESLMPVRVVWPATLDIEPFPANVILTGGLGGEYIAVVRQAFVPRLYARFENLRYLTP